MTNPVMMSVLLGIGLGAFAWLAGPRFAVLLRLKRDRRFNQIGRRLGGMLRFALGQQRMLRDPVAGIAHVFIYGGFVVVSIATITQFAHAYSPGWHFPGLSGRAGLVYALVKDVFEALVLIGVSFALWRRLKPRPTRVGRSAAGIFILAMIAALMLTDFLISGGRHVYEGTAALPWSPGGYLAALALAPLGRAGASGVGTAAWWAHCVLILVFLCFLPLGKHFHVITAFPNVFVRSLWPPGQVQKLDLEHGEQFGIRSSVDLTWQMALNFYSCTECGRCDVYCPTVLTGKPLSHRQLNLDLKRALDADRSVLLYGGKEKAAALPDLVGGRILPETIWACTTCGSCDRECPVMIENVPRIINMRQNEVLMKGAVSPEMARAFRGMENQNNPWGIGFDKRDAWAAGLDIPRMADIATRGEPTPLLYWVGCAGSFDERNQKVSLAMVRILRAAGVPFAILGQEEGCTGDTARRAGNEYLFQSMAAANVELLNRYKVKRIVTQCPHCFHTLGKEYRQFGGNYEVVPHVVLIKELIAAGRLKLTTTMKSAVAYHDACYLGRYAHIYAAPRDVLRTVPGTTVVELPRHGSRAVCCGAGGARYWVEEHIGERINEHRSKEVLLAGTDSVASSCPFCLIMLRDGIATLGREDVRALDVAEIVAQAL